LAEQTGDDLGRDLARAARGIVLIHNGGSDRTTGYELLVSVCERPGAWQRSFASILSIAEVYAAREKARLGDTEDALDLARRAVERLTASGSVMWAIPATAKLVDVLLTRGLQRDLAEAGAVIERWTEQTTDLGVTLREVWSLRMRAQLARARREESSYRELRERYQRKSAEFGFEGHSALAAAMQG
jgi:adenylate cyclase